MSNKTLSFIDYKRQIDEWTDRVNSKGVTLSDGSPIPFTFWKTFLGLKRKVHQDMYAARHKVKEQRVMPYVAKTIHFINLLPEKTFFSEVKKHIALFEADKNS